MFGLKVFSREPGRPARDPLAAVSRQCGSCRHFRNDPAYLEAELPGLASLSSGSASVRDDDGLCLSRERFVSVRSSCANHAAVGLPES